jgi:hypothetical protein
MNGVGACGNRKWCSEATQYFLGNGDSAGARLLSLLAEVLQNDDELVAVDA